MKINLEKDMLDLGIKRSRPFKLMDDTGHGYLCGVLSGFAYAFGFNVFLVRLVFLLLLIPCPFIGAIYVFFAMFADSWEPEPSDYETVTS